MDGREAFMDPQHLVGYGYTDQDRKPYSQEHYAILLTSLNNVVTLAVTTHDIELFKSANVQLHRIADEAHNNGYQEVWHIDTQSYTVVPKQKG